MDHADNCDETCHNIIGGYRCSCQEGFMLATDQKTCNGKVICVHINTSSSRNCTKITPTVYPPFNSLIAMLCELVLTVKTNKLAQVCCSLVTFVSKLKHVVV